MNSLLEQAAGEAWRPTPAQRGQTLGDQACRELRAALRQGMLAPGERLTTRSIAGLLGISVTPAREALNRLVAERLLEYGDRRTAVVPILTRARYAELCLIRLELEGLAARQACGRISPSARTHLDELFEAHEAAYAARDAKRSLQFNEDFHFTIYAAADMPALLQMLETLWLQVGPSMNLLFPSAFDLGWTGGRNHRRMLEAIDRGDGEMLVAAVRQDLEEGRTRLERILPEHRG
jgi:DNA-binding GntR family transcriptional regulator